MNKWNAIHRPSPFFFPVKKKLSACLLFFFSFSPYVQSSYISFHIVLYIKPRSLSLFVCLVYLFPHSFCVVVHLRLMIFFYVRMYGSRGGLQKLFHVSKSGNIDTVKTNRQTTDDVVSVCSFFGLFLQLLLNKCGLFTMADRPLADPKMFITCTHYLLTLKHRKHQSCRHTHTLTHDKWKLYMLTC